MLKTTTWHPDSCECELHYQWDSNSSQANRVHTPVETFRDFEGKLRRTVRCAAHSKHSNVSDLHLQVTDENQRKNMAQHTLLKHIETVAKVTVENGSEKREFVEGKRFLWSFDPARNLVVDLHGFSDDEKITARTVLNKHLSQHTDKIILA